MDSTPPQPPSRYLGLAAACTLIALLSLAIPLYVIRPFRPQGPHEFLLALTVRSFAPWLTIVCAALALYALLRGWPSSRWIAKSFLALALILTTASIFLARVNIFEIMFKPYSAPVFASAADSHVDADDKVLAVTLAGQSHAYPVRTMGYHHIVNDTVGGQPIAATYCTLCHTGLVWSRKMRITSPVASPCDCILTFRLAGINNGNALLRDEQTSSIWQQSTGEALFGPLKGQHLTLIHSDELTFALWRSEQPNGQVLQPNPTYENEYDPKDWERHVARTHVVVDTSRTGLDPHTLMLGISINGQSRAYPVQAILAAGLIEDRLGSQPILILTGPDHASIRVFNPQLSGQPAPLTFAASTKGETADAETSSTWNFKGCATAGPLTGHCLIPLDAHRDFWFDWLNHNPATTLFKS